MFFWETKKSITEANTAQLNFFSNGNFYPARAQDVKMWPFMQMLLSEKSFCSRLWKLRINRVSSCLLKRHTIRAAVTENAGSGVSILQLRNTVIYRNGVVIWDFFGVLSKEYPEGSLGGLAAIWAVGHNAIGSVLC